MKGIILLANHFEDTETILTIDLIRRASIELDLVSISDSLELTTQYNLKIKAEKKINEVNLDEYDFLIIPGGKAVFETHLSSEVTKSIVQKFYNQQKLIATICAAPSILGQLGYLDNIPFTCFPSCEEKMPNGQYLQNESVVVNNNLITAKAAGATFDFAYEIIKYVKGQETADKVINAVYYKKRY